MKGCRISEEQIIGICASSTVLVVRELERLVMERGLPGVIVSDNGCELTSSAVLRWSLGRLDWQYIARASPCKMPSTNPSTGAGF